MRSRIFLERQTNHYINEQIALLLNALKPQPSQFPSGYVTNEKSTKRVGVP